jgi:ribonuclease P protein component
MKTTTPAGRAPSAHTPAGQSVSGHAPPLRGINETHVSTQQPTPQTHTRISRPHEQPGRPSGVETSPGQGTQAAHRYHSTETTTLTPKTGDQRLPQSKRIRKRAEFVRIQQEGRRRAGTCFVVITDQRGSAVSRLGITASRRVGGAVVRNRVKRLVREFFRRYQNRIVPPRDVLVIARPPAATLSYAEARRELGSVLKINVDD